MGMEYCIQESGFGAGVCGCSSGCWLHGCKAAYAGQMAVAWGMGYGVGEWGVISGKTGDGKLQRASCRATGGDRAIRGRGMVMRADGMHRRKRASTKQCVCMHYPRASQPYLSVCGNKGGKSRCLSVPGPIYF